MDEGTLVEWLVKVGDTVRRGDIVAVVDTTKSAIEVEVFTDGVVQKLLVEPGTTVPVGTPLAVLGSVALQAAAEAPAEATPEPAPTPEPEPQAAAEPAPEPPVTTPIVRHLAHEHGLDLREVPASGPDGRVTREDVERAVAARAAGAPAATPTTPAGSEQAARAARPGRPEESGPALTSRRPAASPLARRRATALGVDLASLAGSGAAGAITVADVERAAQRPSTTIVTPTQETVEHGEKATIAPEAGPAAAGVAQAEKADAAKARAAAMRQTIANLMARSKREIPHYYLRTTVDFHAADAFVRHYNTGRPVSERLLPAVLMLKAAALGIRKVPEVNGLFTEGGFQRSDHVHLGVAVSLRGGGLVAPAIHDADTLELPELMAKLKDLVARTRAGRLRGSEMSDPTITVTNLGEQGVEVVHGVIYPPQVALVGFGTIVARPWAVDGMLTVRPIVTVTLAADHRVTDGHRGGLYLAAIDSLLQRPEEL
jgi:pyruvate dehydrogenase E2 component (dihydrolipoamide acetyltransferase)